MVKRRVSESVMNREKVRAVDKREDLRLKDGGSVRNRMKEGYKTIMKNMCKMKSS